MKSQNSQRGNNERMNTPMKKNIVEATNARIDEVLTASELEVRELTEKMASAQAEMSAAQAAVEMATSHADPEAFEAAKQAEVKASRLVEMYQSKLEQLKSRYLVPAAENARTVAEIREYQTDLNNRATAQIVALVSEIESQWNDYAAKMKAANDVLGRWHENVYQQHRHSGVVVNHPADLKFDDTQFRWFNTHILGQTFFRRSTGRGRHTGMKTRTWTTE